MLPTMESFPNETRNPSDCIDFDVFSQAIINTEPPSVVLFSHRQDGPQPAPTQKETKKVGKQAGEVVKRKLFVLSSASSIYGFS